ncbi:MAG TPA: ABC-2 transporter permease [Clostridiaceae bacterium]|nr:ABC-2 transporter permease [Clostridiaceae bacterium]
MLNLHLIMKDVLIQKKQIAFGFFYLLFVIFAFQNNGVGTFIVGITAFTYLITTYSCASEEKNRADVMINSLPVRRSHIVAMKYLSVFIFFIAGTLAYMLFTGLLKNAAINIKIYMLTLEGFLYGFISVCLMTGIYFPVYFKVGYMKSRILNLILFFSIFTGISYLAQYIQQNDNNILNKLLMNFSISQRNIVITAILLALVIVFQLISYGISVKIYNSREL